MLETIREAWGWTGLEPAEVVKANAFGNVIVRAADGAFWRICPEELTCERIAADRKALEALLCNKAFEIDWEMERLVELAAAGLGAVTADRCYCLKVPAVLGGAYGAENLATISRRELIAFAGDVARQIKDLPDGAEVKLVWNDRPEEGPRI